MEEFHSAPRNLEDDHATAPSSPGPEAPTRIRALSYLSVWTGEDDDIAIRVLDPHLPVLRSRVDVRLFEDPSAQTSGAVHGGIEVIDFEPEQDAMAMGCPVGLNEVGVVLRIPSVQLEDQRVPTQEPVVEETMGMVWIAPRAESQQGLVPGAAGLHVPHRNQRLRPDRQSSRLSHGFSRDEVRAQKRRAWP